MNNHCFLYMKVDFCKSLMNVTYAIWKNEIIFKSTARNTLIVFGLIFQTKKRKYISVNFTIIEYLFYNSQVYIMYKKICI